MSEIWKNQLALVDEPTISWPKGSEPMHVGLDPSGEICVWYRCDPSAPREQQRFRICGTGFQYPEGHEFLGTVVDGRYVWHIFIPEQR